MSKHDMDTFALKETLGADNINGPAPGKSPIDYFLHANFSCDASLLFRARVLIVSQCATVAGSALLILLLLLVPVPVVSRLVGVPICVIIIVVLSCLLLKLKRHGSYNFCSQMTVWTCFLPTVLGTFITGGFTASPVAHLLLGPPLLMAFFFGGARAGFGLAIVVALIMAVALYLENHGYSPINVFVDNQLDMVSTAFVIENIAATAMFAFLYEYVSGAVRKARDKEHARIARLAQTDPLTGLVNRRVFDEALVERIAARYDSDKRLRSFVLGYLDLNGFKPINDRHGHDVGDQVLRAISIRLRSSLQGRDLIGRQGGDEFMLLLEGIESEASLNILANRFLQIIAEPIETSAGLLSLTASLGFAFFPKHGTDIQVLKKAADAAMYDAKRKHLGWHIFNIHSIARE
jgi:diguanylate cyclase (GGDEF)-like protein